MSKYHSRITEYEGIKFHSQKEARRYQELRLLEKAGKIRELTLQPQFPLSTGKTLVGRYIADFGYWTSPDDYVVEDVKGFDTPLSKWKRRHVKAQYGIEVLTT